MADFLHSMTWPFLACLVLTGIHVYLGIHVIARKVIFVDLALATIAALGAVWAALLGWDLHEDPWVVKGFSLGATFLGAAVFSLTRMRHERVPHEAVIGITYAVALAAIILGTAKLPHGAEEVRDMQAGSILWVDGTTIAITTAVYAAIGLFHWVFRRQFLALSLDPEAAHARGQNVRLWDFLFYVSFGCVVTSSVSIAGVLLVFSYLVIPSVVAVLFAESIGARLVIGWSVGTLVSAGGVSVSYFQDLPSGPVIVVGFGIFLIGAGLVHAVQHSTNRTRTLGRMGASLAAVVLVVGGSTTLRKQEEHGLLHLLTHGTKAERITVLARVADDPGLWPEIEGEAPALLADGQIEVRLALLDLVGALHLAAEVPHVLALLGDPDDTIREAALHCLRQIGDASAVEPLLAAAGNEEDEYLRVELAETVLELGDARGVPILLDVMETGAARQARKDAWEHLIAHVTTPVEFHAEAPTEDQLLEIRALREWWQENWQRVELR